QRGPNQARDGPDGRSARRRRLERREDAPPGPRRTGVRGFRGAAGADCRSHQASDGERGRTGDDTRCAAGRRGRLGSQLGRSALTDAKGTGGFAVTAEAAAPDADMATLARGGRLNVFGFVLRLAGMVPFLFIGGRIYGPAALGR